MLGSLLSQRTPSGSVRDCVLINFWQQEWQSCLSLTPAIPEGAEEGLAIALAQHNAPSTVILKLRPQVLRLLEEMTM